MRTSVQGNPKGIPKDSGVYEMIWHYASHLDLMATVSMTIPRKLEALPEFARVPVRYLSIGIPMREESRPARDVTAPLRIIVAPEADRWLGAFPKTVAPGITWPEDWTVKAPLPVQNHLRLSRPPASRRADVRPGDEWQCGT